MSIEERGQQGRGSLPLPYSEVQETTERPPGKGLPGWPCLRWFLWDLLSVSPHLPVAAQETTQMLEKKTEKKNFLNLSPVDLSHLIETHTAVLWQIKTPRDL